MNILIAAEITESVLQELQQHGQITRLTSSQQTVLPQRELEQKLREVNPEILIIDATPLTAEAVDSAPALQLILSTRGNPINIDLEHCRQQKLPVGNAPGRNANAVAEFTLALMLSIMRRIPEACRRLKDKEFTLAGSWKKAIEANTSDIIWSHSQIDMMPYHEFRAPELALKTVGLIGFGHIGQLVAKKCQALDVRVQAYDPYYTGKIPEYVTIVSLEELAATSDIISLHAKENPETLGLVDSAFIRNMKDGAFVINTSRGKLIDRYALIQALQDGKLAGAALDVYDYEPLCADDPLLTTPNLICTPHIAGASRDVVYHHSQNVLENFRAFISGQLLPYHV